MRKTWLLVHLVFHATTRKQQAELGVSTAVKEDI